MHQRQLGIHHSRGTCTRQQADILTNEGKWIVRQCRCSVWRYVQFYTDFSITRQLRIYTEQNLFRFSACPIRYLGIGSLFKQATRICKSNLTNALHICWVFLTITSHCRYAPSALPFNRTEASANVFLPESDRPTREGREPAGRTFEVNVSSKNALSHRQGSLVHSSWFMHVNSYL